MLQACETTEVLLEVDEEIMAADTVVSGTIDEEVVVVVEVAAEETTVEDEMTINSKLGHWPTGGESLRQTMPFLSAKDSASRPADGTKSLLVSRASRLFRPSRRVSNEAEC